MTTATLNLVDEKPAETLTETLQSKLSNPATTSDCDLYGGVNEVLKDVGMTAGTAEANLLSTARIRSCQAQSVLALRPRLAWLPRPSWQRRSGEIDPAKGRTSISIFARHFAASAVSSKVFGKR